MDLPAELRILIFEYVLAPASDTVIRIRRHQSRSDEPCQPAITRTCRQLRQDSLPVFYALSNFKIVILYALPPNFTVPKNWLRAIGAENAKHITRLDIDYRRSKRQSPTLTFDKLKLDPASGLSPGAVSISEQTPGLYTA